MSDLKRHEYWPEEPKILIVHADTDHATALAEILQVKLEIHAEVKIVDLTNYNELRLTIVNFHPDLVVLGDFGDFEQGGRIHQAVEHAALLAFRVNPFAIVVYEEKTMTIPLPVIGVDIKYDVAKPIENLIYQIQDVD